MTACALPGARKAPSSEWSLRLVNEPAPTFAPRELGGVLADFSDEARGHRESEPPGGAMPAAEVANWRAFIAELDDHLARPLGETSAEELERARQVLSDELELDSRAYAEMPAEVVEPALERSSWLSTRAAEVRRTKERALAFARRSFTWPVTPVAVTSPFGVRLHPITRVYGPHPGVDLAAQRGQPVMAAAAGTVVRAEYGEGYGNHVDVDHGGGVMTRYGHLGLILVQPGIAVKQGEMLGLAGDTGLATGVHLHFEVRRAGQAVDPVEEIRAAEAKSPVANR